MKNDTICAISTPLGRSGIGIVRLSGPETYLILERLFRGKKGQPVKLSQLTSHTVKYGFIRVFFFLNLSTSSEDCFFYTLCEVTVTKQAYHCERCPKIRDSQQTGVVWQSHFFKV